MSKLFKFDLQRFAEGAAATSDTGVETGDAGQTVEAQTGLEDLFEVEGAEELEEDEVEDEDEEIEEESFEDLIKGKHKNEFNQRVNNIVQGRVKNLQGSLDKSNALLNIVADRYGVDATDFDALEKALMEDDSNYEEEALKRGLSVDSLKYIKQIERQNESFTKEKEERDQQQKRDEEWNKILEQSEGVKEKFPDFDIESEMKNKSFGMMVAAGVPVEHAYIAANYDKLQPQIMSAVAKKTEEKVANTVKSNKKRPQEGGKGQQSFKIKKDLSKLSDAERERIYQEVMLGKKVVI